MISAFEPCDAGLTPAGASPAEPFSFCIDRHVDFFTQRVPGPGRPGEEGEQCRVRRLLSAIKEIHEAGRGGKNPAIKRLAQAMQMPFNSLRRLYYGYTLGCEKAGKSFAPGDWRSVLNWSKVKSEKQNLPFAFLEFWRGLGETNQRKWKPAWDELMQIIRSHYDFKGQHHAKIPGYAEWPVVDEFFGHPAGMSYENLMRHTSTDYDTKAARQGRAAASALRMPVLKTRVGLLVGQEYQFDDVVDDSKVLFQKKPMRPLAFGAVDVLTDCLFKFGAKPTLWDEERGVKQELTEREFLWFFLSVLCTVGYRRDQVGTTVNLEGAKATIREPYLSRLQAILGRHVRFYFGSNAGNHTRAAHAGQFGGQPKGNPRTKALCESKWGMFHNQQASQRGQVGLNRDNSPAQLYGAEKYTGQIIRQAEANNVPLTSLQLPFNSWPEWCRYADQAVQRINLATDHQIQGWAACGFERKEWRTSEDSPLWLSESEFASLSDLDRSVLIRRISDHPELCRIVKATRWEAFQRGRRELTQLPLAHLPEVLGREFALDGGQPIAVGRYMAGLLSFQCEEIDPDPIHFYARDRRAAASHFIPNGQEFICFVNPFAPTHLIACDDKLRVVAECERYQAAREGAGLHQNLGYQTAQGEASRVRLNLRHDDESRAKRRMKAHNEQALIRGTAIPINGPTAPVVNPTADDILARESNVPQDEETW